MEKIFKHVDGVIEGTGIDMFEFGDLGINIDNLEIIPKGDYPVINQYKYKNTKSACTIVNAYKDACYLYGIKANEKDMQEVVEFAHNNFGYQYGKGRFADLGMKAVEKRWEIKHPDKPLYYSTVRRDDPDFYKIFKKGYMVGFCYKGNYQYNKDYQSDNILDGSKFGVSTYGHRTSLILEDKKVKVIDSAGGTRYNEYELKEFTALIQNGVINETFFLFVKEIDVNKDEISRLVALRKMVTEQNKLASGIISQTNDEMYKSEQNNMIQINIQKLKTIQELIKNKGGIDIG